MVPNKVKDLKEGFMVFPEVMVKNSIAIWKGIQVMAANLKLEIPGAGDG